jgi:hypothetical protein
MTVGVPLVVLPVSSEAGDARSGIVDCSMRGWRCRLGQPSCWAGWAGWLGGWLADHGSDGRGVLGFPGVPATLLCDGRVSDDSGFVRGVCISGSKQRRPRLWQSTEDRQCLGLGPAGGGEGAGKPRNFPVSTPSTCGRMCQAVEARCPCRIRLGNINHDQILRWLRCIGRFHAPRCTGLVQAQRW